MSPAAKRCLRPALLLVGLAAALTAAPAAQAEVGTLEVQRSYAGPISPTSGCSADQDAGWNWWFLTEANILPQPDAGAHTDYCVAFGMTPNMEAGGRSPWTSNPGDPPTPPALEAAFTTPLGAVPNTVPGTGDDLSRAVVDLPEGYAGTPGTTPTCTEAEFALELATPPNCPANTQIGRAGAHAFIVGGNEDRGAYATDTLELDAYGPMYNLPPGPNDLGRLGVSIAPLPGSLGAAKFFVRLVLTEGPNPRVRTITENIPTQIAREWAGDPNPAPPGVPVGTPFPNPPTATVAPDPEWPNLRIFVESVGLEIWGSKTNHPTMSANSFSQNATTCTDDQQATVSAETTYGTKSAVQSAPHRLTGCELLPFDPSVSVTTTEHKPGVPTGVAVTVGLEQSTGARESALLKDAAVTLPAGLELGAQVASGPGGLPLCTAAQFAATTLAPAGCPAASQAGTVNIVSPLIDRPFAGKVFLGEQAAVGELPALYIEASLPGATAPDAPRVKLVGTTEVDASGRLTATLKRNPQLRFSEISLTFPGGPNALFSTPRACGTTTAASSFVSYASATAVSTTSSLTIDQGCDAAVPFAPKVTFGASNPQAGAFSPTQVTVERADGSAWLDDLKVSLPAGFLADLNAATECGEAAAATGSCPDSSRIATVVSQAGVGEQPLELRGSMFITTPTPGTVAGVVIVVRAKIGGIDLGDVIVPGKLVLRQTDAGIDFSADLPTRFKGLALNLRKVVVDMDRPGFALNPSGCGPIGYSATAKGDGGQVSDSSGQATYTGCGALPFKPRITAKLTGDIKPLGHPGMFVEMTNAAGNSNLKGATVLLPDGVAADLANVQISCSRADFDAVQCPANTRIGTTTVDVAIATEQVRGDVFLVKVPGETLPGLGLSYTGRYSQRVMSIVKINAQGRLMIRFDQIPDLPVRRMTVDALGGAKGPLQLGKEDCANGTRWDAEFVGQGGQTAKDQIGLRCAARSIVKLSDKGGLTLRNFDFGGRNLRSAKISLPSGWSIDRKKAKSKKNFARLTGGTTKPKYGKASISLAIKGSKASTLRVKVIGSAIKKKAAKKAKKAKAKTVTVKVKFVFTDGAIQNQTIKVKAR